MGLLLLLSAALSLPASAYTVTTVTEKPQWQVDWSGTEARPDWQEPDAGKFENWTVMLVKIEEALLPYVSADDQMALFIGDVLRGQAGPSVIVSTGEVDATQFLLKIYGNENLGDEIVLTMKYYNAQLKQVFTLSETMTLDEDVLVGFDEDFIPPFTQGSPKYPVTKTLDVASILASAGITPAEGDMVGAFVGDECRGVGELTINNSQSTILDVFLRKASESIVLKYYDAAGKRLFTIDVDNGVVLGDANGDGKVDIVDVTSTISFILGQPIGHFDEKAADINGDGVVNIVDVTMMIDRILN